YPVDLETHATVIADRDVRTAGGVEVEAARTGLHQRGRIAATVVVAAVTAAVVVTRQAVVVVSVVPAVAIAVLSLVVIVPGTAADAGNQRRAATDNQLHRHDLERIADVQAERATKGRPPVDDVEVHVDRRGAHAFDLELGGVDTVGGQPAGL